MLQEALLRVWRRLDTLKEQTSLRAWLYKIATNVSLDMLSNHKARSMPSALFPPADPRDPFPKAVDDPIWLDSIPHETIAGWAPNPEAQVETHESVSLAFLAILQTLLEFFAVDVWFDGEGMARHYEDPEFMSSFEKLFAAPPMATVWTHPVGSWVEW